MKNRKRDFRKLTQRHKDAKPQKRKNSEIKKSGIRSGEEKMQRERAGTPTLDTLIESSLRLRGSALSSFPWFFGFWGKF